MSYLAYGDAQSQQGSVFDYFQKKLNFRSTFVREILFGLAGASFLAASAQVYIPLPNTPVPITLQTYAVLTLATIYGSSRAPFSVLLYLLMGVLGAPVLSEGRSGVEVMLGATGGYLLGFLLASFLIGKLVEKGWDRSFVKAIAVFVLGQALIFLPGLLWLGQFVGYDHVLAAGFLPFIPGGIIKAAMSASTSALLWKILKR